MDEVQQGTSTEIEIESEEVSEYEQEPVEKVSKPINVDFTLVFM